MKRWPIKPLRELCSISDKRADEGEMPYLEIGNLNPKTKTYAFSDKPAVKGALLARANDIIISRVRPTRGAITLIQENQISVSSAFTILRSAQEVRPRFLLFALAWNGDFLAYLGRHSKGALYPTVPEKDLLAFEISVPPLGEQERIVKLMDEADELRKLRAQADTRTAALLPSLFNEMFGDPETNPKGWPTSRAGELMADCDYGTSQKANEEGRGVVVLRMGNITNTGELDLENLKTVELPENELFKQRLRAGDVLFNRTNSRELVGKTGMWDGRMEAVAASYFIRVRFRDDVEHPQHFTTFMNLPAMKQRLAGIARGAVGQANINSKELQAIELPVPPLPLQKEFAKRVTEIREMEAAQSASRQRLESLFQSLLHRAFNGEL